MSRMLLLFLFLTGLLLGCTKHDESIHPSGNDVSNTGFGGHGGGHGGGH